jgi:hypothetical protein
MLDTQTTVIGDLSLSDPLSYSSILDDYEEIFPDVLDKSVSGLNITNSCIFIALNFHVFVLVFIIHIIIE